MLPSPLPLLFSLLLLPLVLLSHLPGAAAYQGAAGTKLIFYRNDDWFPLSSVKVWFFINGDVTQTETLQQCSGTPMYRYRLVEGVDNETKLRFSNLTRYDADQCDSSSWYSDIKYNGTAVFFNATTCVSAIQISHTSTITEGFDFENLINCPEAALAPTLPPLPTDAPTPTSTPSQGVIRDPDAGDWWVWVILGVGGAVLTVTYVVLRKYYPRARNSVVVTFVFAAFNLATDIAFVVNTNKLALENQANPGLVPETFNLTAIAHTAIAFLIVPTLLNLAVGIFFLLREMKRDAQFQDWVHRHRTMTGLVVASSFMGVDLLNILNSHLFNHEMFTSNLSKESTRMIQIIGLLGNFVQDVPQLTLQILLATNVGQWQTVILLSTIGSILALCFGIVKRAFQALLYVFKPEESDDAEKSEGEMTKTY